MSCAGKQKGLSGERSGLWFEMLRVVREVQPRWVLAENVRGAVNLALDTVCSGLEDEGYVVWPFVVPAAAFGAPHRRERLAIVAARRDVADALAERLEGSERTGAFCDSGSSALEPIAECGARLWPMPRANDSEKRGDIANDPRSGLPAAVLWPTPRGTDGTHGGPNQRGSRGDLMLPSAVALWPTPHRNCSNGAGEHGDGGKNIQTAVKLWPTPDCNNHRDGTKLRKDNNLASGGMHGVNLHHAVPNGTLSPDWVECLQGFPLGWTDIDCDEPEPWQGWPAGMGAEQFDYEPPRTCGKIPNRAKRLKCLGNAVVPQQFAAFFEAIREMNT